LPVGVNVLPNDYKAAFAIAKECNAAFVQLDVFTDKVKTDYSYSDAKPFDVSVDLNDFKKCRKKYGMDIPLFITVQPKHYKMLEAKSLKKSVKEAIANGADVIVVTGKVTGKAPTVNKVKTVKQAAGKFPVFIGSGLTPTNANKILKFADGAIVGTYLKTKDNIDSKKVEELMKVVHYSKEF
jgi:membrane complex biogenesis BtpA family protein